MSSPIGVLSFLEILLIPIEKPFVIRIPTVDVILEFHQDNFVIQSNSSIYKIPPILIDVCIWYSS